MGAAPRRQSDPRSLRSQDALRAALLRLVARRDFAAISLRDIAAEAGVSYPTLFNHYQGKDDLFLDIARVEITGLLAAFQDGRERSGWRPGLGMCGFVDQRRTIWITLLTAGAKEAMRTAFIQRGRELAVGEQLPGHGFPLDVVSGLIASGTFEIMAWWLAQSDETAIATVARMLETMVIEPALGLPAGHFASAA